MITKQQYVEYLISTFGNYTGSHLAEHLDDVSHDVITDYLCSERLTSRSLWELVAPLISNGPDAFLILDDSVQDKRYSRFIELVKRQYSGAEHGTVRGIGVVNLVHSRGAAGDFWPLDFRIYAPDSDGKTKNAHWWSVRWPTNACKPEPCSSIPGMPPPTTSSSSSAST
jgi:hypothetical protein